MELAGLVVTGDALYAQQNLSRQVVEQGGGYFWGVQDNQPGLRADIALLFAEPPWGEEFATATERRRHGDRWEEHTLWSSTALNDYLAWPHTQQVCCVEGIENRLHYVRDVTMKEDASQVRSGSAPQVMAALRNTALGLLRQAGTGNIAAALRHYSYKPLEALALLGIPAP